MEEQNLNLELSEIEIDLCLFHPPKLSYSKTENRRLSASSHYIKRDWKSSLLSQEKTGQTELSTTFPGLIRGRMYKITDTVKSVHKLTKVSLPNIPGCCRLPHTFCSKGEWTASHCGGRIWVTAEMAPVILAPNNGWACGPREHGWSKRGNTHNSGLRATAGPAVTALQPWSHLQRCHHHLQWQHLPIQQPQMQQNHPPCPDAPALHGSRALNSMTLDMANVPSFPVPGDSINNSSNTSSSKEPVSHKK